MNINNSIDEIDNSIHKIELKEGKVIVHKYNWLQRLIKKIFKL